MPTDLADLLIRPPVFGFLADLVQVDQSQLHIRVLIAYFDEIGFCYFNQWFNLLL